MLVISSIFLLIKSINHDILITNYAGHLLLCEEFLSLCLAILGAIYPPVFPQGRSHLLSARARCGLVTGNARASCEYPQLRKDLAGKIPRRFLAERP